MEVRVGGSWSCFRNHWCIRNRKLEAEYTVNKTQLLRGGALWEPGSTAGFKVGADSKGDNSQCRHWSMQGNPVLWNHSIPDLINVLSSWGAPSVQQYSENRGEKTAIPLPLLPSARTYLNSPPAEKNMQFPPEYLLRFWATCHVTQESNVEICWYHYLLVLFNDCGICCIVVDVCMCVCLCVSVTCILNMLSLFLYF